MRRTGRVLGMLFMAVLMVGVEMSAAGPRVLKVNSEPGDGNGPYFNLIVREVRVTPIVAHAGDTIRIEMVLENRGDNVSKTIPVEIWANKKVVASRLFTFGWGDGPGKIFRVTFEWDTRGVAPGEYRIRGDAFVWEDASPFDNDLGVSDPLVLLPAGAPLPEGKQDGGTAVEVDTRWKPRRAGEAY